MANRVTGQVKRLYVTGGRTYIRLDGLTGDELPLDGYFELKIGHSNYNALYSLSMVAAVNRYPLQIRTRGEIDPTEQAEVQYMVIDW